MRRSFSIHVILILCLTFLQISVSQDTPRSNSSIVEIGGLYGQLRYNAYEVPQIQSASTVIRDKFVLYPAVRISHLFILQGKLSFDPFMGYSQFGGKSDDLSSGHEDELWIDAVEWGGFISYHIGGYGMSLGGKLNYHIDKRRRDFIGRDQNGNPQWEITQETVMLNDYSGDVGIKIWLDIYDGLFIASESWFGISSLVKSEWPNNASAHQTNYRLMIGYRI